MAYLLDLLPDRQLDDNANPMNGAKLYAFAAGTTTPLATYTDAGGLTQHPHPIPAAATGFWPQIWVSAVAYKLEARKADGTTVLWTRDNVRAPTAISAEAEAAILADLASTSSPSTKGAGMIGDKYDASGAVEVTLHEYTTDDGAYNVMGFIPRALKAAIRNKSSAVDVSSYVQACITQAIADDRGVFFPRGRYVANNLQITGYTGSGLQIDGRGAVIRLGANQTGLTITNSENVHVGRGIKFDSTAASGLSQIGVLVVNSGRLEICGEYENLTYGIRVNSTKTGLLTGAYPIPIRLSPIVKACAAGVYCAPTGEYVNIVEALIQDCTLYGAVIDAGNVHIRGGTYSGNGIGIQYDGSNSGNGDHGSIVGAVVNHNDKCGIWLKFLDYSMLVTGCNVWANIGPTDIGAAPYDTSVGVVLTSVKNVNLVSNIIAHNIVGLLADGATTSIIRGNTFIASSASTTANILEVQPLLPGISNSVGGNTFEGTLLAGANNNDPQQFYVPASFLNSWVAFGGVLYQQPKYWIDGAGVVHLTGVIKNGTMGSSAFLLPAGFRPSKEEIFAIVSNDAFARIHVQADGNVVPKGGSNVYVSLDGIQFRVEA